MRLVDCGEELVPDPSRPASVWRARGVPRVPRSNRMRADTAEGLAWVRQPSDLTGERGEFARLGLR